MKKSKEERFAMIVEQLIDGAKDNPKIKDIDAVRAKCYTKKYGYVEFMVVMPKSKVIASA